MPQFDQISFLNQIFWLFFIFYIFYFIFIYYFFPILLNILKYRKKLLKNKQLLVKQQQVNIELNKKKINNIYFQTSSLLIIIKNYYIESLIKKFNNINLYNKKTYNNIIFKLLISNKILNK